MFSKIAAQAFEDGDFLNILLRFGVFEAHFLIKSFPIKKRVKLSRTIKKSMSVNIVSYI